MNSHTLLVGGSSHFGKLAASHTPTLNPAIPLLGAREMTTYVIKDTHECSYYPYS